MTSDSRNRFGDKTIIVTGAAGGIGEVYARALAAEGANVVVADLNDDAGKQVAADINGLYVSTDVADEQRVSSEHADWPIGIGSVVEHKSKMIVRMSGRFQHSNFELADFKLITLVRRVGIFDRFRRIGTVQDTRAG